MENWCPGVDTSWQNVGGASTACLLTNSSWERQMITKSSTLVTQNMHFCRITDQQITFIRYRWNISVLSCSCYINRSTIVTFYILILYIFCGLKCVGHSFAYIAHFVFVRDVWIRTQRAAVASRRATNLQPPISHFASLHTLSCTSTIFVTKL